MKSVKIVFVISLLLLIYIGVNASNKVDYTGIRGDFKIFKLGDSMDTALDKIQWLIDESPGSVSMGGAQVYDDEVVVWFNDVFGYYTECTMMFDETGMDSMELSPVGPEDLSFSYDRAANLIREIITPELIKAYGEPTYDMTIPVAKDIPNGEEVRSAGWKLKTKSIDIYITKIGKLFDVIVQLDTNNVKQNNPGYGKENGSGSVSDFS